MWIKFVMLYIPFVILMVLFAPTLKWKVLFSIAGAPGIYLALIGYSLPSTSGAIARRRR